LFFSELLYLLRAGLFEAACTNELNGTAEFVFVEPGAVGLADIDDDVGTVSELDAVHQFVADGARDIANRCLQLQRLIRRSGGTRYEGLLFAVGADLIEGVDVNPNSLAARALEEAGGADGDAAHGDLTAGAAACLGAWGINAISFCPTMRAELCACEHYAEAGWASYGGESGFAKIAAGGGG
jgi:hypothetical protein